MPAMGDSVSEGTILEWHKQEGDSVSEDETIVEISTDKVDAEVPSPATGTVVKVHAAEGDTVHVGALLAEIALDGGAPIGERPPTPSRRRRAPDRGRADGAAPEPRPPARPSRSRCPRWASRSPRASSSSGPSSRATRWQADETIVEISTDKVDAEVPAPASGVMGEILAEPGDTVTVGQVIGRMKSGPNGGLGRRRSPSARPAEPAEPGEAEGGRAPRRHPHLAGRAPRRRGRGHRRLERPGHAALPAGSRRTTCSRPPPATARPRCGRRRRERHAHQGRARRCSPATWTSRGRSRPPPRSARSPSRCSTRAARSSRTPASKVSFTHLIAYAIARAATEQMPVMAHHFAEIDGKPHRVDDGAVNLGIAVDVEKQGRRAHADGAGDPRRRPAQLLRLPRRLQRPDRAAPARTS